MVKVETISDVTFDKCPSVSPSAFSIPCEDTFAAVRRLPNNLPLPTYKGDAGEGEGEDVATNIVV
jgi:hypothetical protein